MNNIDNNDLKRELENNLPDYVFGNLSDSEKQFFETNINQFPDLMKEIADAKLLFNRFDKMDFDRIFHEHTRNLTIKVNNRIVHKKANNLNFSNIGKFLLPSMGLLVMIFFAWTYYFSPNDRIVKFSGTTAKKFSQTMIDTAVFNTIAQEISLDSSLSIESVVHTDPSIELSALSSAENKQSLALLDEYDQTLETAYNDSPEIFWGVGLQENTSIINELNNMSEDEFQVLLKELDIYETINY